MFLRSALRSSRPACKAQARAYNRVSAEDALKAHKKNEGVFVDVRHPDSFNELAPLGFVNIPHFQLRHFTKEGESVDTLPRDEPIYLIDTFGYYSTQSAKALDKSNYREVYVVDGGLMGWFFKGGEAHSNNVQRQKQIERIAALPKTYSTLDLMNKEMGFGIDAANQRFPYAMDYFDTPEEAEEAHAASLLQK